MNTSVLRLLSVLLSVCLLGATPPEADHTAPGTYYPLTVGNYWVYEFSTSINAPPVHESLTVLREEGDKSIVWIKDDYNDGSVLLGDGQEDIVFRTPDGFGYAGRGVIDQQAVGVEPQLFLKTPLTMGATWTTTWGKYEVTAVDVTETVPAGTFKNCVEVTFRANSGDVTVVALYAPGVGMIMRDENFIAVAFGSGGPVRSLLRLKAWQVKE